MNQLNKLTIYLFISLSILSKNIDANYRFSHLTIKDGLSQSSVKSIYQDWKGFMWFGTSDGLNRYNGYSFTIYRNDPGRKSSICGNDISFIYENPFDSTLWIGTRSDGLSLYCRNSDTFVSFKKNETDINTIPTNNINSMASVRPGELWIATGGSGLINFSLTDTTFTIPEFSKKDEFRNINTILADRNGALWLGTSKGLFKYEIPIDRNLNTAIPEQISDGFPEAISIISLTEDLRGNIWIGTSNSGLIRYHPGNRSTSHYSHIPTELNSIGSNTVRSIVHRKNGTIWIGTDNGLYNFDQHSNRFRAFRNDAADQESINDDMIFSMYEDRSGVLWIGTFFGGVNRVDPEESRFIKHSNFHKLFNLNKATNHIRSIYKDAQNGLWLSSSKGLILLNEEYFKSPSKKEHAEIFFRETDQYYVFGDSYQNLYVSNAQGFFIRKNGINQFHLFTPSGIEMKPELRFLSYALEDSDRMVWFFTRYGLLKYNPKTNEADLYNPKNENGTTSIQSFISGYESYNGKIWCGTSDGKIYRFDRYIYQFEKILPREENQQNSPFNHIFSIYEPEPGSIWFGSNNGLYNFTEQDRKLKRFYDADGLSNNVVYSVLADKQKRIWCSTNLGLSILDVATNAFLNYTWEDGLQSNEFNQSAYLKTYDGIFYYGGIDGINIINPSNINPNPFIPPVYITSLWVNHEKVSMFTHPDILSRKITETKEITLKYNQAIFTFEFAALNYIHPNKNQYKYKLEGYDKDWINEGNQRTASYTNIPPGEYTFMVMGSNNSGIWNEVPATIRIMILPPFWKSWWFKSLSAIVLILFIYMIIRLRVNEEKKKNEWLQKQIDEKTTDLTIKNKQIEEHNLELIRINDEIKKRNLKIEEKNQELNLQNEQIVKQRDSLIELSQKLEEANHAKVNFFTNVSHELRTPLTLIIGPLKEMLIDFESTSKDEIFRKFKIIYANASKLLSLINQLLDFREVELSQSRLELSRNDLVKFIRDINFLFYDLAMRMKISFVFNSAFPALEVCFDQEKMEKVITNLISNAFKFTPEGGKISIEINSTNSGEGPRKVIIRVTDTGIGIPEENLGLIFENFYHTSLPGAGVGNGIGLALVRKYTELHGGNVTVNSKPGEGTSFTVSFPLVNDCSPADDTGGMMKKNYTYSETISASLNNYLPKLIKEVKSGQDLLMTRLVLIDDDESFRNYLTDLLSEHHLVYSATNYSEGMEIILSKHPDLIITDVNLPDKSGFDLCMAVKENNTTCHIPGILLTSLNDIQHQISGLKSGADSYIIKPFDLQLLNHNIDNLIGMRKRIQAKYYFGSGSKHLNNEIRSDEKLFIDKVINEIEKNIHDSEFDVEKLCKAIGLSQPQTYRKIKSITDLSISEFIRNTRLKKAARMFAESNLTVSEVAYQVGFNDPNYFTKCFTRLFGQTPTEYIRLRGEIV